MTTAAPQTSAQRTPSTLRWLLNERAMLVGEIQRRRERIARLEAEVAELQSKAGAFDMALELVDERVEPSAGGAVRATAERYGQRGALIHFIRDQVVSAGEAGIDTVSLCLRVIARFSIPVDTQADVNRYRDTVSWCLRRLTERGILERAFHSRGGHVPSVWRAKRGPSLADLAERAAA